MSALGRSIDSILNLKSFHQAHLDDVANDKNSSEVVNRNGNEIVNCDAAVSYKDDEMLGLVIDEEEEFDSPVHHHAKDVEAKSNDAMVSVEVDQINDPVEKSMKTYNVFGVITDEGNFTDPLTDSEDDCIYNEFVTKTLLHRTQIPKKGILKRIIDNETNSSSGSERQPRRSIFYSRKSPSPPTNSSTRKNARFSSDLYQIHEVMSLQPYSSDVWWDHNEYDKFKRTAVFLANVVPDDDAISFITESHEATPDMNSDINNIYEKWWCKFGHSRRGLEHLCGVDEGNLRHTKVGEHMKAVINEDCKQVKKMRGKGFDHSAIARVSMKHTQWAKNLALATGYADANAVVTEFDEEIKKNREDYMHIARRMSDNEKTMGESLSSLALNKVKKLSNKVMLKSQGS